MMVNPRQTRKGNSFVSGCLIPLAGLALFIGVCYGICLVIFLAANPNPNASSGLQMILALFS